MRTLPIFIDEVQDCPKRINAMKYFCENAPPIPNRLRRFAAGDRAGLAVFASCGKVNFMQVDPITFTEFLLANGDKNLVSYLKGLDIIEPVPAAFFNPICGVDFLIRRGSNGWIGMQAILFKYTLVSAGAEAYIR